MNEHIGNRHASETRTLRRLAPAVLLAAGIFLPTAATATDNDGCNADGGHAHISLSDGIANESAGTITFVLTCNPCGRVNANTWWKTTDGSATAPADYTAINGLLITVGTTSDDLQTYNIVVTLNDDTDFEGDETFTVGLGGQPPEEANPSVGAPCLILDDTTATGTIQSDDPMNSPPVAAAGPDQTVECATPGGTPVTLNGSGSSDPDNDSLTYTWREGATVLAGPTGNASAGVSLGLGAHTIVLTVDDGNGETDTDTVVVTVADTTDPVVTLNGPSQQTVECALGTYVEQGATASDACQGALPVSATGSVDVSTVGTYVLTYTATDSSGNQGSKTRTVVVEDTTAPVITLSGPAELTLECAVDTYAEQGATAADACQGALPVQISGSVDEHTPGTYAITYTATDASSNAATQTRTVEVVDTIPPEITLTAGPVVLWPPNHKYSAISLDDVVVSATDLCDENVSAAGVTVTSVSSDEEEDAPGNGDGNTLDDIVIAGDCRTVNLRAERQGRGNGRVYTIGMAVSDASGNTATASFAVHVPHEAGGAAVGDGPAYTVAGCPAATSATMAEPVLLEGRIVDVVDGAGLAGVEVIGPGKTVARTDARGRYTLAVPAGLEAYAIRLERDGYVPRSTYVDAREATRLAELSLIPGDGRVDLASLDQALRASDAGAAASSRRWVQEPVFEFFGREFDGGAGIAAAAARERVPEELRRTLEGWVRADVPLYTGGVLKGERIRWVPLDRGDGVAEWRPGVVQVLINWGACTPGVPAVASVNWRRPGILEGGRIELLANCGGLDRRVFSHQLAHQMGLSHPQGGGETAQPSILGNARDDGPTAADVLHARILYQRLPGNQAPDRDPPPSLGSAGAASTRRAVYRE